MKYFPHPLRFKTLLDFCHPQPGHLFDMPVYNGIEALAANGVFFLKAHRGLWAPDDFPAAPAGFLDWFANLPFDRFPLPESRHWHPFADHLGKIFIRQPIHPFTPTFSLAEAPAVAIGRTVILLSMLQLAARLPRAEFSTEDRDAKGLFIRCNGALGFIAAYASEPAFAITPRPVRQGPPAPSLPLPGWPPPPPID